MIENILIHLKKSPRLQKKLNPTFLSFTDFFKDPTRDNYVEGPMNSMSKLTITPKKQYAVKRKLYELADSGYSNPDMAYVPPPLSSNDVDEMPVPPEKKKIRKHKKNKI